MATRKAASLPKGKHIRYESGDYAAFYDGRIIGYRATRIEAESLLDGYVFGLLMRGNATIGAVAGAS